MSNKKYFLIIIAIFLLAITVRIICFVGLIGSDDLNYNRGAYDIATGSFSSQFDHQHNRLGLLLPVAGLLKIFGVHELSTTAFPFFCFIVTFGVLVHTATTCFGKWTGIIAAFLYTFLPLEIFHATMLLTDLPSAACIALSGAILYKIDVRSGNNPDLHCSDNTTEVYAKISMFLGGLALGWAYLIRETALFFGVFVGGYMLYRAWKHKRLRWTWACFWLGVFTVIGSECGYYYWVFGTPFYRYLTVDVSVNWSGAMEFTRRYFYGMSLPQYLALDRFRVLFNIPDFGFYYFFVFAGTIYGIHKRIKHIWYFIGWFLTTFLLFALSSVSLSQYQPLRSVPRYFLSLSFPGIIIMTIYFQEIGQVLMLEKRKELRPFFVSVVPPWILMFGINLFWFSAVRLVFLVFIAILGLIIFSAALRTWFHHKISLKYIPVILPALLLYVNLLPGIYMTAKGESPRKGITCERDIRPLFEFPLTHIIYTDSRTEEIMEYFYQYQYDAQILNFDDADVNTLKNTYIIANWERVFFLNRVYDTPIPEFLYHPPPEWRRYAKIGGYVNPCLIYEIP